MTEQFREEIPEKTFKIDLARLTERDKQALEQDKGGRTIERLRDGHFLTGEETMWLGSSDPFQYSYPLTPFALMFYPDEIDKINQKRKAIGETHGRLRYIAPDPFKEGYTSAYLSLEEIDPETGERKNTPRVTRLQGPGVPEVRDPEMLKKFTYNPRAMKEDYISLLDQNMRDAKTPEEKAYFQTRIDLFTRYFKIK